MHPTLRRYWIQLTADRKKFGLLCAMVAVGMLLWARIVIISNVPRTATATNEDEQVEILNTADSTLYTSASREKSQVNIQLDRRPERDPFVIDPVFFPKPDIGAASSSNDDKSAANPVEDSESREARLMARLKEATGRLTLEAVMSGPPPMAIISGKAYRIGQTITTGTSQEYEFVLKEVSHRTVTLDFEGRKFELRMTQLGQ
ncbi:MAG: hypothetical protein EA377_10120 [Phycisphaerales bacterium]|nr:MAG: hypothetical protein EA377_10120 [Phycisphaerales bacterium]